MDDKKHLTWKIFWQAADFLYNTLAFVCQILYAGVAQWLESLPSKQIVVGSSPITRSIIKANKGPWLLVFDFYLQQLDHIETKD